MKRVPTCRPIGDSDNLFINMPKLKCHNLGLTTLSMKNLQGTVPQGYGHYCNRWAVLEHDIKERYGGDFKRDFMGNYHQTIEEGFLRHRAEGYKYWDYEGLYPLYEKRGGWETFRKAKGSLKDISEFMDGINGNLMWDEMWCQRAMDSAIRDQARHQYRRGHHRARRKRIRRRDRITSSITSSRGFPCPKSTHVASCIMGQNPLELYYTRIAKERGLGETNPEKIDMYRLSEDGVTPIRSVTELRSTPLGVNLHSSREKPRLFW